MLLFFCYFSIEFGDFKSLTDFTNLFSPNTSDSVTFALFVTVISAPIGIACAKVALMFLFSKEIYKTFSEGLKKAKTTNTDCMTL